MKKLALFAFLALVALPVSAHVTVKPNQAGVGSFQTFTISVPSEKEAATTQIRLELPEGLGHVTPTVKQGWIIEVKEREVNEVETPYEIVWSGGRIPGHYRDEFTFSTQVPATVSTLAWKAHQSYSDGTVVSWNLDPKGEQPKNAQGQPDFSKSGPYSETKVIDDVSAAVNQPSQPAVNESSTGSQTPLIVSSLAILIALAALVKSFSKKT